MSTFEDDLKKALDDAEIALKKDKGKALEQLLALSMSSIKETVPFDEATPSPTGTYWRCYWGGKRKCFFAPPPNT